MVILFYHRYFKCAKVYHLRATRDSQLSTLRKVTNVVASYGLLEMHFQKTLRKSNSSPLRNGGFPIGISEIPGVYFQGRTVSFREGIYYIIFFSYQETLQDVQPKFSRILSRPFLPILPCGFDFLFASRMTVGVDVSYSIPMHLQDAEIGLRS